MPISWNEAPTGEHNVIRRVCRDDSEELRGCGVVRRLEFLLRRRKVSVEASLDGILVYGDAVAAAHIYCVRSISNGGMAAPR